MVRGMIGKRLFKDIQCLIRGSIWVIQNELAFINEFLDKIFESLTSFDVMTFGSMIMTEIIFPIPEWAFLAFINIPNGGKFDHANFQHFF